jgi:hypothetical protein
MSWRARGLVAVTIASAILTGFLVAIAMAAETATREDLLAMPLSPAL